MPAYLHHWPLYGELRWTGVDLFFVLSGFLIGGLLFKELRTKGQLKVGRFIIRRGLKIWPSYFVFLRLCGASPVVSNSRTNRSRRARHDSEFAGTSRIIFGGA